MLGGVDLHVDLEKAHIQVLSGIPGREFREYADVTGFFFLFFLELSTLEIYSPCLFERLVVQLCACSLS